MTFLTILVLVGAVQGLVCGMFLLLKNRRSMQNRLLGFILVFLSMALVNLVLMEAGVRYLSILANMAAYVFPLLIVMPVGPLLYHYILIAINPDVGITSSGSHFYSVVVDLIPYFAGTVLVGGLLTGLITNEQGWRHYIDEYNVYADIIRWGSLTTYVVLAARKLKQKADDATVRWLRNLVVVFAIFQLIWLLHLLPYLLPVLRNEFISLITWYPIYVPLSIMIYWLSINGYLRMSVGLNRKVLPPEIIEETNRVLTRAMENDKLFLDPSITVAKLAKSTGLSSKNISTFLNQHRGVSFNQFVNAYRVEELKRRLKSPGSEHLTITGLGLECGFNSAATMQRAFRELVQCSPRQYQLSRA